MENNELKPLDQSELYQVSSEMNKYRVKDTEEKLQYYAYIYILHGESELADELKIEIDDFIITEWMPLSLPQRQALFASCDAFFEPYKLGYNEQDPIKKAERQKATKFGEEKFLQDFFGELNENQIEQLLQLSQADYDEKYTRIHHPELYGKKR